MSHSNFRVLVLMQVHQGKRPDVIRWSNCWRIRGMWFAGLRGE